ncbi:hypothetical protein XA68_16610 [Ophiocordyceps unilateralis]|uniref:Phosphoacetylglucosamine mutase n=1 Tax=Ophiocordyceps unilateralis TaxID=268505 RepID=A0A2A9P678_OPHUN|nr:hypothetical protein XA68_16610 [Ophiocordyceps unilateralis]
MDDKILAASAKYPTVAGRKYKYGTAGFRMKADMLSGVAFRVGLVAGLRSRKLNGQAIGVMITASHNPAADNGVKIVDPMGEMLEQEWEAYATHLVNCPSDQALLDAYKALAAQLKIDLAASGRVVYGRDTRPSGHSLAAALAAALNATNTDYTDYKILTTPQLHYITRCVNSEGTPKSYGQPSERGYYSKFADAFVRALRGRKIHGSLTVDCANGVGGPKMSELLKAIPKDVTGFEVRVVNDDVLRPEILNLECGADYVKTKQRAPQTPKPIPGARCCSLDGDADRLIYHWIDPEKGFVMLDGDRISSLTASFIGDLVRAADLEEDLRIGVVQTAYANGASTTYIEKHLRLPIVCTPTGVKHLHHAACQFDIGVYFEANGHGTVVFSQEATRIFKEKEPQSPAQKDALETLSAVGDLINQTVGDAFTDMLLVETILAHKVWTLRDWAMTYADLPNRLIRVEVGNKDLFRATDAERRLSRPVGAQDEIDQVVRKYTTARSFARASGTENACRVYAEAATRSEADELAHKVAQIVKQFGS